MNYKTALPVQGYAHSRAGAQQRWFNSLSIHSVFFHSSNDDFTTFHLCLLFVLIFPKVCSSWSGRLCCNIYFNHLPRNIEPWHSNRDFVHRINRRFCIWQLRCISLDNFIIKPFTCNDAIYNKWSEWHWNETTENVPKICYICWIDFLKLQLQR